jgi:adenine-specific DNA methylase
MEATMNFKAMESAQKLRGGYYTQPDIAEYLARWVLEVNPKQILEPSSGDGVFVEALAKLGAKSVESLTACELNSEEAELTRKRSASNRKFKVKVHADDFLRWSLPRLLETPQFDAVLGNPPFVRYQYLDSEQQARAEQVFSTFHLQFTKHTNAWVPFIVAALAQLRPGGRLAMVVPSELLHVIHARSLRHFLLRHCSKILVLDPDQIWFSDTLQGVMLLLAEKSTASNDEIADIAVLPIKDRATLNCDAGKHVARANYMSGSVLNGKWMLSLLDNEERALLERLGHHSSIQPFKEVASVDVGIVTGANRFFLVPDAIVAENHLEAWAHPMFGRSDHVQGVIYDKAAHDENRRAGLPTNFLWFKDAPFKSLPKRVQNYILQGESEKLHTRYKCRIRSPWYTVPSVYSTPVGMLKRSHHFPRLVLNKAKAFTTDTAYRIEPKKLTAPNLVFNFVNSLTALTAELEGRHYGGGVLELVPSEIEKVLIPLTQQPIEAVAKLDQTVRRGMPAPEELLRKQDELVLRPLGISKRESEILLRAYSRLRLRRQRSSHEIPLLDD